MSIDVKGGLAYGYYLTAEQVEAVVESCSDFEQDLLFDSWLIPLKSWGLSDALFAVSLRAADLETAQAIHKDSIEPGLAVQMIADFHKYCDGIITEKIEPQFYVYTRSV